MSPLFERAALHIYVVSNSTRLTDALPEDWIEKYIKKSPNSVLLGVKATNLINNVPIMLDCPKEYNGLFKVVLQLVTTPYSPSFPPTIQICQHNVVNKSMLTDVVKSIVGNEKIPISTSKSNNNCNLM